VQLKTNVNIYYRISTQYGGEPRRRGLVVWAAPTSDESQVRSETSNTQDKRVIEDGRSPWFYTTLATLVFEIFLNNVTE